MLYDPTAKLHASLGADYTRAILAYVHLHVPAKPKGGKKAPAWEGTLQATDSYQAVSIPVTFQDTDNPEPGEYLIPGEAFKTQKRTDPLLTFDAPNLRVFRQASEWQITKVEKGGAAFDLAKFKPEDESVWEIGFDVEILSKLGKGLGSSQLAFRFTIDGKGDPSAIRPIIVRPVSDAAGRTGLLMPVRIKDAA